jgi:hypothetical protein
MVRSASARGKAFSDMLDGWFWLIDVICAGIMNFRTKSIDTVFLLDGVIGCQIGWWSGVDH